MCQDALRSKGVGLIALQREMDANGDGNISSREFRAAVNRVKGLNVTEQEVMDVYHHLLDQRQAAVAAGVAAGEGAEAASPAKDARLTGEEAKPPETAAVEGTGRWNKIKHAVGFVAAAKPNLTMAEIIQFFAGVAPAAAAGATVSPVPSTAEHVAPTAAAASAPAIGGAAVTQSAAAADAANVEEGGRVREGRGFDLEVMAHRLRAAGVEGLLGCMDLAYVRGMWHEHTQVVTVCMCACVHVHGYTRVCALHVHVHVTRVAPMCNIHIFACMCVYACACAYVYAYKCVCICMLACLILTHVLCTCVCTYMYDMRVYICVYIHAQTCMYTCTSICTCTCTCMYIHICTYMCM
jgi:hypothetical protein